MADDCFCYSEIKGIRNTWKCKKDDDNLGKKMKYDAGLPEKDQKDSCFLHLGGNGPWKCWSDLTYWNNNLKQHELEYTWAIIAIKLIGPLVFWDKIYFPVCSKRGSIWRICTPCLGVCSSVWDPSKWSFIKSLKMFYTGLLDLSK